MQNTSIFRKAMILANQLNSLQPLAETSFDNAKDWKSEHFRAAYAFLQRHPEAVIIDAIKSKGQFTRRIVLTDWKRYNTLKGTGRTIPDGYKLFVDVGKMIVGERSKTVMFKNYEILG